MQFGEPGVGNDVYYENNYEKAVDEILKVYKTTFGFTIKTDLYVYDTIGKLIRKLPFYLCSGLTNAENTQYQNSKKYKKHNNNSKKTTKGFGLRHAFEEHTEDCKLGFKYLPKKAKEILHKENFNFNDSIEKRLLMLIPIALKYPSKSYKNIKSWNNKIGITFYNFCFIFGVENKYIGGKNYNQFTGTITIYTDLTYLPKNEINQLISQNKIKPAWLSTFTQMDTFNSIFNNYLKANNTKEYQNINNIITQEKDRLNNLILVYKKIHPEYSELSDFEILDKIYKKIDKTQYKSFDNQLLTHDQQNDGRTK